MLEISDQPNTWPSVTISSEYVDEFIAWVIETYNLEDSGIKDGIRWITFGSRIIDDQLVAYGYSYHFRDPNMAMLAKLKFGGV